MKKWILLVVLCLAGARPVPDFWKKGIVKPVALSPKMAALPKVTPLVVVPILTNMMRWTEMMPYTGSGQTIIPLDYPQWVWVQRCNDLSKNPQVFTNVWQGPMPPDRTIDFISWAPRGVNPMYRFYLSFQNTN